MTTPFDNYLEQVAQNDTLFVIPATIIVLGLFIGTLSFTAYCVAICLETRSQRIKRVYNHKFNHKRELL